MKQGILLYAHNSSDVDYLKIATVAGFLAKKNLNKSVSIITDSDSLNFSKTQDYYKQFESVFEHIILTDIEHGKNYRNLHDGAESKTVPFINHNRPLVYDLTPYDQTLLIDADFLIFTKNFNKYFDLDANLILCDEVYDIGSRLKYEDYYISQTGPKMYWATCMLFKKCEYVKIFFELSKYIQENYNYFANVYNYNPKMYRNDVCISIAKHIMDNFQNNDENCFERLNLTIDKDVLVSNKENSLTFLLSYPGDNYSACTVRSMDIHIMNKQSILRNFKSLMT